MQLALSRTEGRFKKITQTHRIWNAYELINGQYVAGWPSRPPITDIDLAGQSLRPKQKPAVATRTISQALQRFESVSTEHARARHAQRLHQLAVPTDYAVVPESTTMAFFPLDVAIARRKGAERLIVVDAHAGTVHPGLGVSLSEHIYWLRESLAT